MTTPPARKPYRRALVKLSGEAMAGGTTNAQGLGINPKDLVRTATEIANAKSATGAQLVIIPGGGNIVRGAQLAAHDAVHRDTADHMGMLGTIINAIAIKDALANLNVTAHVVSALPVHPIAPAFERHDAIRKLEQGHVLIAAAGVGQPYFSTDSGAALRAAQLGCDAIVKATKVDGVYDDDPATNPNAKRYDTVTIDLAIEQRLRVMDLAALTLARDNHIDIAVCDFHTPDNLTRTINREPVGTRITADTNTTAP